MSARDAIRERLAFDELHDDGLYVRADFSRPTTTHIDRDERRGSERRHLMGCLFADSGGPVLNDHDRHGDIAGVGLWRVRNQKTLTVRGYSEGEPVAAGMAEIDV